MIYQELDDTFIVEYGALLFPFQSTSMPWYWKAKYANKLPIATPRLSAHEVIYFEMLPLQFGIGNYVVFSPPTKESAFDI